MAQSRVQDSARELDRSTLRNLTVTCDFAATSTSTTSVLLLPLSFTILAIPSTLPSTMPPKASTKAAEGKAPAKPQAAKAKAAKKAALKVRRPHR